MRETGRKQGDVTRPPLRKQVPMDGEMTQPGKPEHARRDERRAELPGRLIHRRLPQSVAELGAFCRFDTSRESPRARRRAGGCR